MIVKRSNVESSSDLSSGLSVVFYHGFYHCCWMGSLTNPCFPACTALFLANHRRPPRAACLSTLDSLMCKRRGANEILNEMNVCITKSLSLSLALILWHQDTEGILMKILLFPCWQEPMPSPLCRSCRCWVRNMEFIVELMVGLICWKLELCFSPFW